MSGKKQPRGVSWFLSVAMANSSDSSSLREKEFILATVQAYKPFTRAGTLSRWSHHTPGSETGRAAFRVVPSLLYPYSTVQDPLAQGMAWPPIQICLPSVSYKHLHLPTTSRL